MTSNETLDGNYEHDKRIKQGFYTVAFIVGTIGNVLVLIVVAGRRERRTVNDIFILNLAISDLTYLFICITTNLYLTVGTVPMEFYCWFVWPTMTVTICLSIFTLTSMAIHRRRVILNPFKPEIKHRYVFIWIVVIWIMAILIVIPMLLVTRILQVEPYGCMEVWPSIEYRKAYTAFLFTCQYALPLTIIAVEYVRIGLDLFRPRGPRARGDSKRERANMDPARRKENMQVIKTLATIVVLFTLTMLPAQLGWMLVDFGGEREKKVGQELIKVCEWLLYTHACTNPIVYGTLTKHYRKGYIKYLTMIFCCRWRVLYRSLSSSERSSPNNTNDETSTNHISTKAKKVWGFLGRMNGQNGHVSGASNSDQSSETHNQTDRLLETDKNKNSVETRDTRSYITCEKESVM